MRMELPALGTDLAKALDESARSALSTDVEWGVCRTLDHRLWSRLAVCLGADSIRSSLLPSVLASLSVPLGDYYLDWRP